MNCLIIEDVAFIREIYCNAILNFTSIKVVGEAATGTEGLKALEVLKPDLLLLDLVLPEMNGIEILQKLSEVSPHTKAVVITSITDQKILTQATALGAIDCLAKPFTKEALIQVLNNVSQYYSEVQNG